MASIGSWLQEASSQPGVVGALLVEYANGLSLGSTGVAKPSDGPILKWQFDKERAPVLHADYRGFNVYVTVHQDALVAIYKQQQSDEEETEENASNS